MRINTQATTSLAVTTFAFVGAKSTDSVPTTAPSVSGSVYYGKSDKAPDSSLSAVASVNDAAVGGGMVAVADDGKVDAGILFTAGADGAAAAVMTISASAPTCAEGFLQCFDGKVRGTSIPCSTSCAGKCCVGTDACSRFTGNVCKDGSCSGTKACWFANIPYVVKSCKAIRACNSAGFDGTVGVIVNSCNFENSCAYAGEEGGKAGDIQNSCAAKKACYCAGTQTSGGIGKINTSCNAYKACFKAGAGYTTAGIITSDLVNCCNTESVCKNAKESTLPVQCPCPTTTEAPTTQKPTLSPTTKAPTMSPTSKSPSIKPVMSPPTPPTRKPSQRPTTRKPTVKPTTKPTTAKPIPRTCPA